MPANKKPRKPYKKGYSGLTVALKEDVEWLQQFLVKLGLIVELKSIKGLEGEEVKRLSEFFFWAGAAFSFRTDYRAPESKEWVLIYGKTIRALMTSLERFKEKKLEKFIFNGDELTAIREGFAYFYGPMQEAVTDTPIEMTKIYMAMLVQNTGHEIRGYDLRRYLRKINNRALLDYYVDLKNEEGVEIP